MCKELVLALWPWSRNYCGVCLENLRNATEHFSQDRKSPCQYFTRNVRNTVQGGFPYYSAMTVANAGEIYRRPVGFGTRSLGHISIELLRLNFEEMFTYSHHITLISVCPFACLEGIQGEWSYSSTHSTHLYVYCCFYFRCRTAG